MGGQVSFEAYPRVRHWRERAKGQKTLGPELKRHKKQGLFRGTAGGRLGDEKTGARGRSAREAH